MVCSTVARSSTSVSSVVVMTAFALDATEFHTAADCSMLAEFVMGMALLVLVVMGCKTPASNMTPVVCVMETILRALAVMASRLAYNMIYADFVVETTAPATAVMESASLLCSMIDVAFVAGPMIRVVAVMELQTA
jgi:hypothetical protein